MPGFNGSPARIACWLRPDPCFHSILSGRVKATAAGLRSAAIALVRIVADAAAPRNKWINECIQSSDDLLAVLRERETVPAFLFVGSAATEPDLTRRRRSGPKTASVARTCVAKCPYGIARPQDLLP